MTDPRPEERLAYLAYQLLFPESYPSDPAELARRDDPVFQALRSWIESLWPGVSEEVRRRLIRTRKDLTDPVHTNTPALSGHLLALLGANAVSQLSARPNGGGDGAGRALPDEQRQKAAARMVLGRATDEEAEAVRSWIAEASGGTGAPAQVHADDTGKDSISMADDDTSTDNYTIDLRGLPDTFDATKYNKAVKRLFKVRDVDITTAKAKAHRAYVTGALIRDSYFDPKSPGFTDAFVEQFDEGYLLPETLAGNTFTSTRNGLRTRRIDVYFEISGLISEIKGDSAPTVQELAAVSDEVIDRGPVDDNLEAKVRSAFDDFVGQTPSYDTLELPDIVTEDSAQGVYEPVNIRSCSMIGAAMHLDRAGLMSAVDQAAQDWSDGVLPVGDSAGRLFDPYVWDARDRLDPAARQIQYDRIKELDDYLLRFCSAVSERERGLFLSEYLTGSQREKRSPQPQDASVRKTARDLLGYASLHGWAYTQFAARRIGNHIRQCVEIIENSEVQKAYGVNAPLLVVERVNMMSTGVSPNISKEMTLASTGKEIIDLLASKSLDIAANRISTPLFPVAELNGVRAVFSRAEYQLLLGHVENWLAANAITDTERFDAAQPRDMQPTGALPAGGGFMGSDSTAIRDQLMQMVGAGQMPSADQLNQLFGAH